MTSPVLLLTNPFIWEHSCLSVRVVRPSCGSASPDEGRPPAQRTSVAGRRFTALMFTLRVYQMAKNRTSGSARRLAARQEFWPNDTAWTGENEKGWFRAPRTLPLLLALIASKQVSGNTDP